MLKYTDDKYCSVGAAVITLLADKSSPLDVTHSDLDYVAKQFHDIYVSILTSDNDTRKPFKSYINKLFFNSVFDQARSKPDSIRTYAKEVFFSYQEDEPAEEGDIPCVFFPEYKGKFLIHRTQYPLFTGQTMMNFTTRDELGIPVSGLARLCLHVMPFGTTRFNYYNAKDKSQSASGHLLFHHLDDYTHRLGGMFNLIFARRYFNENWAILNLIRSGDSSVNVEFKIIKGVINTIYVTEMLNVIFEVERRGGFTGNITGYFFNNGGKTDYNEVVRLDNPIIHFLERVYDDCQSEWKQLVRNNIYKEGETEWISNNLLNVLPTLPENSYSVLKRFFAKSSWLLVSIFVEEVIFMDRIKLEAIQRIGERLYLYMDRFDKPKMNTYTKMTRARGLSEFSNYLRQYEDRWMKSHDGQPLVTKEDYQLAFITRTNRYESFGLVQFLIGAVMREYIYQHVDEYDRIAFEEIAENTPESVIDEEDTTE